MGDSEELAAVRARVVELEVENAGLRARNTLFEDALCDLGHSKNPRDATAFAELRAVLWAQTKADLLRLRPGEAVVQTRLFGETLVTELRRLVGDESTLILQARKPLPPPHRRPVASRQIEMPLAASPPAPKPARKPRARKEATT